MADTTSAPTGLSDVDFVALKMGQTIGRYEILSILGQGGFGITYQALDTQLGRAVAIKELYPTGCQRMGATIASVKPAYASCGTGSESLS